MAHKQDKKEETKTSGAVSMDTGRSAKQPITQPLYTPPIPTLNRTSSNPALADAYLKSRGRSNSVSCDTSGYKGTMLKRIKETTDYTEKYTKTKAMVLELDRKSVV